jgi:DsbC/DsbD-like thiol-disulfide interchange protein
MIRILALGIGLATLAAAGEWSEPVEVRHDDILCLAYRAKLDGPYLIIRATIEPGWHTFAMDNKQRADEKLAGRKALAVDRPTEIGVTGGIESAGGWRQTPPKDFSQPELRLFSWGFEREALFVTKVRRSAAANARITVRAQACTEAVCKNIDVAIALPVGKESDAPQVDLTRLVPVR